MLAERETAALAFSDVRDGSLKPSYTWILSTFLPSVVARVRLYPHLAVGKEVGKHGTNVEQAH